ncbi:CCR4-NOT transcription complex subunit 11, variant 2 [Basidiobolus ranarum]|uniref:CCR4-NOT transcription complex subunit 11 n=1 Tax=Basidiobolus ranarum TaxID=34480 RepID=A0ABR2WX56_9FUNG
MDDLLSSLPVEIKELLKRAPNVENKVEEKFAELESSEIFREKNVNFQGESFTIQVPTLDFAFEELLWLNPSFGEHTLEWDYTMCEDAKKEQNTCQLLAKAYEEPLSMVEQQLILQEFENDVKFVYRSGLTPDNLSALVENNPTIVIEALIQLSKCKEMAEYLNALSDITTLHSLEVVNRLTTSCEIPQEFLHQYLERHISSCDSMTDRNVQNRQVRLVS